MMSNNIVQYAISKENFDSIYENAKLVDTDLYATTENKCIKAVDVNHCICILMTKKKEDKIRNLIFHINGETIASSINKEETFNQYVTVEEIVTDVFADADIIYVVGGNENTKPNLATEIINTISSKYDKTKINNLSNYGKSIDVGLDVEGTFHVKIDIP